MNDSGGRGGWLRGRRQRRVRQNLDALQGTLATMGMTYRSLTERLDGLINDGQVEEALRLAEAARAGGQPDLRAAAEIVTCLWETVNDRHAEALAALDRALALAGAQAEPDVAYHRGVIHVRTGDLARAQEQLALAAACDVERVAVNASLSLGHLYAEAGEDERALPLLRRAHESGQASVVPRAAFDLALLMRRAGDLAAARALYEEATAVDSTAMAARARIQLSDVLAELGAYDEARACLEAVAEADPDPHLAAAVAIDVARMYHAEGDLREAERRLRAVAAAGNHRHVQRARLVLGTLLAQSGDTERAVGELRAAAEGADPGLSQEAAFGLAGALREDARFLVTADPSTVLPLLDLAPGPVADVYRTSAELHGPASPAVRRQVLALDAARRGDPALSARISAVALPQAPAPRWGRVAWSTGTQLGGFRFTAAAHEGPVTCVATATVDGRPVAVTGGADGLVRVWDLTTGQECGAALRGHEGEVASVAVTAVDGRTLLVSGGRDRTVRLWDLAARQAVCPPLTGHSGWVTAVATAVVRGRAVAVTGDEEGVVRVWDAATGRPAGAPLADGAAVRAVATAVIGRRTVAVTGDKEGTVRIWDLAKGKQVQQPLRLHDTGVECLSTAVLDGRPVGVAGSLGGQVVVWDLAGHEQVGAMLTSEAGESGGTRGAVLAWPGGRPHVVTGGSARVARVRDLATGEERGSVFTGSAGHIGAVAVAEAEGRVLAVLACADGKIRVWEPSPGPARPVPLPGHRDFVAALTTTELDGRALLVSADEGGTGRIWDLATGEPVCELTGHANMLTAVATAEIEGRPTVVTGARHETVRLWDPATGAQAGEPLGPDGGITSLATARLDGRPVLVTGDGGGEVAIWDLTSRQLLHGPLPGHDDDVEGTAFARLDGRTVVVTVDAAGAVLVRDPATGTRVGTPFSVLALPDGDGDEEEPDEYVEAVATAVLDGRSVLVTLCDVSDKAVLRLWDLTTGTALAGDLAVHDVHASALTTAVLDGRAVALTGGGDGRVRVWDLAGREQVGPDVVVTAPVGAVALAPDGRLAVTYDSEVTVLAAPGGQGTAGDPGAEGSEKSDRTQ